MYKSSSLKNDICGVIASMSLMMVCTAASAEPIKGISIGDSMASVTPPQDSTVTSDKDHYKSFGINGDSSMTITGGQESGKVYRIKLEQFYPQATCLALNEKIKEKFALDRISNMMGRYEKKWSTKGEFSTRYEYLCVELGAQQGARINLSAFSHTLRNEDRDLVRGKARQEQEAALESELSQGVDLDM